MPKQPKDRNSKSDDSHEIEPKSQVTSPTFQGHFQLYTLSEIAVLIKVHDQEVTHLKPSL